MDLDNGASPSDMAAKLEALLDALAAGQMSHDLRITYDDRHGLWGGTTINIGEGDYERIQKSSPADSPIAVARGDLRPEQIAEVARLLLTIRCWEQLTPQSPPVPDEVRPSLQVCCAGSRSTIWEKGHDLHHNQRLWRVRELLTALGDTFDTVHLEAARSVESQNDF